MHTYHMSQACLASVCTVCMSMTVQMLETIFSIYWKRKYFNDKRGCKVSE